MTSARGIPSSGGETILVAEDSDQVRAILSLILEQSGYNVLAAGSGDATLRIAAAHPGPIHLLICDLNLPGMCGPQIAQQLLALRPGVRILFMSGQSRAEAVRQGHVTHGHAYLEKPFSRDELASQVSGVLAMPDGDELKDQAPAE